MKRRIVPKKPATSTSSQSSVKIPIYDSQNMRCIKKWLEDLTQQHFSRPQNFHQSLKDGSILCDAICKVRGIEPNFHKNTKNVVFKEMENIAFFMTNCQQFGVVVSWSIRALHANEDLNAVLHTVVQVAEKAAQNPSYQGPKLQLATKPVEVAMNTTHGTGTIVNETAKKVVTSRSAIRRTTTIQKHEVGKAREAVKKIEHDIKHEVSHEQKKTITRSPTIRKTDAVSLLQTQQQAILQRQEKPPNALKLKSQMMAKSLKKNIQSAKSLLTEQIGDEGYEEYDAPVIAESPQNASSSGSPSSAVNNSASTVTSSPIDSPVGSPVGDPFGGANETSVEYNISKLKQFGVKLVTSEFITKMGNLIKLNGEKWSQSFIEQGGIKYLCDILNSINNVMYKSARDMSLQEQCLRCFKYLMDYDAGVNGFVRFPDCVKTLCLALDTKSDKIKKRILVILSLICTFGEDGFWVVLQGMSHYKIEKRETQRFRDLVSGLEKESNPKLLTHYLLFINSIINAAQDVSSRILVKKEFYNLNIVQILQTLKEMNLSDESLQAQIKNLEEEMNGFDEIEQQVESANMNTLSTLTSPLQIVKALQLKLGSTLAISNLHSILHKLLILSLNVNNRNTEEYEQLLTDNWRIVEDIITKSIDQSSQGKVEDLANKVTRLQGQLARQNEYLSDMEEQLSNCKKDFEEKLKQNESQLMDQMNEMKKKFEEQLELEKVTPKKENNQVEELNEKISKLKTEIEELKARPISDTNESKDKTIDPDVTKSTQVSAPLPSENLKELEELKKLKKTQELKAESDLKEINSLKNSMSKLKEELEESNKKRKQLEKELQDAKRAKPDNESSNGTDSEPKSESSSNETSNEQGTTSSAPAPPPPPPPPGAPPPPPPPPGAPPPPGGPPPPPPPPGGAPPPPGGPPPPPGAFQTGPVLPALPTYKPKKNTRNIFIDNISKMKVSATAWVSDGIVQKVKDIQLETDEIEDIFSNEASSSGSGTGKSTTKKQEKISFVDPQKSTTVSILLGYMKMTNEEIRDAIILMDSSKLNQQTIESLKDKTPSSDELSSIATYTGDMSLLSDVDKFYLAVKDIPRLSSRLTCWAFKHKFLTDVEQIKPDLEAASLAAKEIHESKKFKDFLAVTLAITNYLNAKTSKKNSYGFKLSSLVKLRDTKSNDQKTTLLQYLASFCEKKYPELLNIKEDMPHLEASVRVSVSDILSEFGKLKSGVELATKEHKMSLGSSLVDDRFPGEMEKFLRIATDKIDAIEKDIELLYSRLDSMAEAFAEDKQKIRQNPNPFYESLNSFLNTFESSHREYKQRIEKEKKKQQQQQQQSGKKVAGSPILPMASKGMQPAVSPMDLAKALKKKVDDGEKSNTSFRSRRQSIMSGEAFKNKRLQDQSPGFGIALKKTGYTHK